MILFLLESLGSLLQVDCMRKYVLRVKAAECVINDLHHRDTQFPNQLITFYLENIKDHIKHILSKQIQQEGLVKELVSLSVLNLKEISKKDQHSLK